jgi:hypothetical protein
MNGAVHIALIGEIRSAYIILVQNPEGKRPSRRPIDGTMIGDQTGTMGAVFK